MTSRSNFSFGSSMQLIALHDYTATRSDELSFSINTLLKQISQPTPPNWYFCKNTLTQQTGLVPSNYVRIQPDNTTCDNHNNKQFNEFDDLLSLYDTHQHWTTSRTLSWLDSIGFSEFRDIFQQNNINGSCLSSLSINTLQDMGIQELGKRLALLGAIEDLYNNITPPSPPPSPLPQTPPRNPTRQLQFPKAITPPITPRKSLFSLKRLSLPMVRLPTIIHSGYLLQHNSTFTDYILTPTQLCQIQSTFLHRKRITQRIDLHNATLFVQPPGFKIKRNGIEFDFICRDNEELRCWVEKIVGCLMLEGEEIDENNNSH